MTDPYLWGGARKEYCGTPLPFLFWNNHSVGGAVAISEQFYYFLDALMAVPAADGKGKTILGHWSMQCAVAKGQHYVCGSVYYVNTIWGYSSENNAKVTCESQVAEVLREQTATTHCYEMFYALSQNLLFVRFYHCYNLICWHGTISLL